MSHHLRKLIDSGLQELSGSGLIWGNRYSDRVGPVTCCEIVNQAFGWVEIGRPWPTNRIKHLRKVNAPINISTVAARAGVQRKTVYKHDDLVAVIDAYRHHPSSSDHASTTRETSIMAALRAQLAAKDTEIRTLRTKLAEQESTIALLYGQLDSHTT